MKNLLLIQVMILSGCVCALAQSSNLEIKSGVFRTTGKTILRGEVGFLTVPENRRNAKSRMIRIKFVRLKSISTTPREPVIYLEGGGNTSTWQAESPKDLTDWLPVLRISDLIFIDQRGTTDSELTYIWKGAFPAEFFVSEQAAGEHYQKLCSAARDELEKKGIDVYGYHVAEHSHDIHELAAALKIEKYSIVGFSFGSHIGMTHLRLHGGDVVNAVFIGADGIDQSFNYPAHLDNHIVKISEMVAHDEAINQSVPDFSALLKDVMMKLHAKPVTVKVKHPLTRKTMDVKVGSFGLALIVRLEIDDTNDIPAIPRLLYSISNNDYSMLEWFIEKRLAFALAVPGNGIHQALASGVSEERLREIGRQAAASLFGNVVNFPFADARNVWPADTIPTHTFSPLPVMTRTLFITGSLDCRTPVDQVNEIMKGFNNAVHIVVENAGHEQAMWDTEVFDEAIPKFLSGEDVRNAKPFYKEIRFIPMTGKGHASIK